MHDSDNDNNSDNKPIITDRDTTKMCCTEQYDIL